MQQIEQLAFVNKCNQYKFIDYRTLSPSILQSLENEGFVLDDVQSFIYSEHIEYAYHPFFQKPILYSIDDYEIKRIPPFIETINILYASGNGMLMEDINVNCIRSENASWYYIKNRWVKLNQNSTCSLKTNTIVNDKMKNYIHPIIV